MYYTSSKRKCKKCLKKNNNTKVDLYIKLLGVCFNCININNTIKTNSYKLIKTYS